MREDRASPAPSRETVMMGQKTLMAQIDEGVAKVSGDKSVPEKLASMPVQFEMSFETMPGTKGSAPDEDLNPYEVAPLEIHHNE